MLLLTGLPDEYRTVIMALENSADYIKATLLQKLPLPSNSYNQQAVATNKRYGKNFKQKHQLNEVHVKVLKCRKSSKFVFIVRDCKDASRRSGNRIPLIRFLIYDSYDE